MSNSNDILERKIQILDGENEKLVHVNVEVLNLTKKFQEKISSLDEKFGKFSPDEIKEYKELVKELRKEYFHLEEKIKICNENQNHSNKYFAEIKSFNENIGEKIEKMEKRFYQQESNIDSTLKNFKDIISDFQDFIVEHNEKINNYYTKLDLDEKLSQKIDITQLCDEIKKSISDDQVLNIIRNGLLNANAYV